jgi:4-amino-4-deoxy-L-arabinose transferase-like glycosyltransferase
MLVGRLAISPVCRATVSLGLPFVLASLPLLLYLPALDNPFERDEGVYATIAQGLLDGLVPYRDLFDNKPPLVYVWYALGFVLFGESVVAPRLIAALFLSLSTLAMYGEARLLFSKGVAYLATGLFALGSGLPLVALHANTEAYMLLPLVGSLLAFTLGLRRREGWWLVVAGVLGGVAVMTKQVAVWNVIALAVVAAVWQWRRNGLNWRITVPPALVAVSASVSIAAVAVSFAAAGALNDLVYANLSYNLLYVSSLSMVDRLVYLGQGLLVFFGIAGPLTVASIFGIYLVCRRPRGSLDYLVLLWAVASAIGVASGGRFYPHYFLHLIPGMSILAAITVGNLRRGRDLRKLVKPAVLTGLLLLVISAGTNAVLLAIPRQAEKQMAPSVYYQKMWEQDSEALGDYIEQRTDPEQTIFNFGRESQVYFYADRRPAARYFYDWAFRYDEETLTELLAELRDGKPVYIIDSIQPPLFPEDGHYRPPEFSEFLRENYEYVGRFHFADVYRLKE